MPRYLVLGFDLPAKAVAFRNQTWSESAVLAEALRRGADVLSQRSGVLILRDERGNLDVVARCGAAEDRCIAAYVTADVRFGRWPGHTATEPSDPRPETLPFDTTDPSPRYLM